jgi:flagellar export protein FliJ
MKRFRFTLAALKTRREQREQEATAAYGKALGYERQLQEELTRATGALEAQWSQRQVLLNQGIAAVEMIHNLGYAQRLQKHCQDKEKECAQAQQSVRQQWELLLQARRQREVVDKFLDRQKKHYLFECQREEQKLLDELAGREIKGGLTAP